MAMEPLLFEHLISNYLWSAAKDWIVDRTPRAFDFMVEKEDGRRIAIEALVSKPKAHKFARWREALERTEPGVSEFILVTPEPPSPSSVESFTHAFAGGPVQTHWVGINQLPAALGLEAQEDLLSPSTMHQLQVRALVKNLEAYSKAPIGALPESKRLSWCDI